MSSASWDRTTGRRRRSGTHDALDEPPVREVPDDQQRQTTEKQNHIITSFNAIRVLSPQRGDGNGFQALAERKRPVTRVKDDTREIPSLGQIVPEPLDVLEVILADARTGLDLDTGKVTVLVLDDKVNLAPVDVPVLVERTGLQVDLRG